MTKVSKPVAALLFIAFFVAIAAILLWSPKPSVSPANFGSLRIDANQTSTSRFTYGGSEIDQSMVSGCDVPASLSLEVTEVKTPGRVKISINDFYVGYAEITSVGEALIASGCGCSTSCICTIKAGENVVAMTSEGFAGGLTYKIYVEIGA